MSAHSQARLTPEQYLEIERAADSRHEYYNGEMFAMSGATRRHGLVTLNLAAEFRARLRGGPCSVTSTDLRVKVSPRQYCYPDIVVLCGEPKYVDNELDTLLNPIIIVEVLSPSTEGHDRGAKSAQYRAIGSLQEYVVVAQSEPRVEILRRQPTGDWLLSESIGLSATCRFESVGCSIPLTEIYENVTFDAEDQSLPADNS